MRLRRVLEVSALALVVAALGRGCLPQTTLPEPGAVNVTATASDGLINGFTTDDGWNIRFSRALVALGGAAVTGDQNTTYCRLYPDSRYTRILNLLVPGPQKLVLLYSLGHCDFGFRLQRPRIDDVAGKGVTSDDRVLMVLPGSDPWSKDSGTSLYLEGSAAKGSVTKTFKWSFRVRVRYDTCVIGDPDASVRGVSIAGGSNQTLDILVRPEALFAKDANVIADSTLGFQPFADADDHWGNGDGEVTLEELKNEPLEGVGLGGIGPDGGIGADGGIGGIGADSGAEVDLPDGGTISTFGDFVYALLVRNVPRFRDTGYCHSITSFSFGARGGFD
jgi:hypothetical protein